MINSRPHPILFALLTFVVSMIGFQLIGPLIGFFFCLPFLPNDLVTVVSHLEQATDHAYLKVPLYIMQGMGTLVGLVLIPLWLLKAYRRNEIPFFKTQVAAFPVILVVMTVIVFMVVNSLFIDWNKEIVLPEFFRPLEEWARSTEDALADMTRYLTQFDHAGQLILAIVVIAVLPAIGEELVFRGIIQHELIRATSNKHLGIWIAAILFSAIHLQFYGFIPRMLLGALFGYMFLWSGNIWMPIIAHFVNNAFSVMAIYLYQKDQIGIDLETVSLPIFPVLISAGVTAALLFAFKKYYDERRPELDTYS